MSENDTSSFYFLQDDVCSPVRLGDSLGEVVESYGYDEFGMDLYGNQSRYHSFGYTGYERDGIAGTYYAQAREYQPLTGRFAARDVLKGSVDDLLSMNEYIYCRNAPEDYVDWDGQAAVSIAAVLAVAKLIAGAAAIGAASGAGIDAGIQGIKIHITKQQKEFQLGSFLGSGVEGAIIGGAAAIPGLGTVIGIAAPIIASGAGAGANSVISQAIDEKEVNWWKTGEEVVVGLFVSGICYKLGKVLSPVKDKVSSFLGIPVRPKSTSIIKEAYGKALDALEKNTLKYRAIMAAGKTPSALTRRVRAGIQEEMDGLLKKYMKELWKVNGKRSIKSLVMTVAGYKSIKSVMGDVLRLALPLYQEEGEESLLEYIDSYMDELMSLYGEKTEICA